MRHPGVAGDNPVERGAAEDKFRALLESAPDAMVIVDEGGNIELVNRQTDRLFGYEREELLGLPFEHLVPERYRDRHRHDLVTYLDSPRQRPMGGGLELFGRRKDGSEFPLRSASAPCTPKAGPWSRPPFATSPHADQRSRRWSPHASRQWKRRA